jgi:hypothetical protein
MNLRLIFGIGLFVIGIVAGVMGIADAMTPAGARPTVFGTQDGVLERAIGNFAIPVVAGLSLALGGLLLGLSLGHWEHPRTHLEPGDQVVNPEGHRKMTHV